MWNPSWVALLNRRSRIVQGQCPWQRRALFDRTISERSRSTCLPGNAELPGECPPPLHSRCSHPLPRCPAYRDLEQAELASDKSERFPATAVGPPPPVGLSACP